MTTFQATPTTPGADDIPQVDLTTQQLEGNAFTSRDEIERIYSTIGVDLRLDDLSEENASYQMNEVVLAATETIASYTLRFYDSTAIYTSPWIRRRATIIGAYYLSMRRANGTQFTREYERIMEELQAFLGDKPPFIPAADGFPSPVRTSAIPTVSAYIVDDRQRYRKLRVKRDYTTKLGASSYVYEQPLSSECQ